MMAHSGEDGGKSSGDKSKRYVRPINELWEMWKPRVKMRIYPFTYALYDDVERVMTSLNSYDRDAWAAAFSSVAKPYEVKASQAEKAGDAQGAKENYLRAYQYYTLARYPTINSDGKRQAYMKAQEMLFKASRFFDIPIQRLEYPLQRKSQRRKKYYCLFEVAQERFRSFSLATKLGRDRRF